MSISTLSSREIFKKIKEPKSIIYIILLGLGVYYVGSDIGIDGVARYAGTVYCLLQAFINYSRIQTFINNGFKVDKRGFILFSTTTLFIMVIAVFLLGDWLGRFVMYASMIMGMGFVCYNLLKIMRR